MGSSSATVHGSLSGSTENLDSAVTHQEQPSRLDNYTAALAEGYFDMTQLDEPKQQ